MEQKRSQKKKKSTSATPGETKPKKRAKEDNEEGTPDDAAEKKKPGRPKKAAAPATTTTKRARTGKSAASSKVKPLVAQAIPTALTDFQVDTAALENSTGSLAYKCGPVRLGDLPAGSVESDAFHFRVFSHLISKENPWGIPPSNDPASVLRDALAQPMDIEGQEEEEEGEEEEADE